MRRNIGEHGYLDICEQNWETDSLDIVGYGHTGYHDEPVFVFGASTQPGPLASFYRSREDKFITLSALGFFIFYNWEKEGILPKRKGETK